MSYLTDQEIGNILGDVWYGEYGLTKEARQARIKQLLAHALPKIKRDTAREIFEWVEQYRTENGMALFFGATDWQSLKAKYGVGE